MKKDTITPEIAQDIVGSLINVGLTKEGADRIIDNTSVAEMLANLANSPDAAIRIMCGYAQSMLPMDFQLQIILGFNQLLPEDRRISQKWFDDVRDLNSNKIIESDHQILMFDKNHCYGGDDC